MLALAVCGSVLSWGAEVTSVSFLWPGSFFCPATSPDPEKLAWKGLGAGEGWVEKCLGKAGRGKDRVGGCIVSDFFPPLEKGHTIQGGWSWWRRDPLAPFQKQEVMVWEAGEDQHPSHPGLGRGP